MLKTARSSADVSVWAAQKAQKRIACMDVAANNTWYIFICSLKVDGLTRRSSLPAVPTPRSPKGSPCMGLTLYTEYRDINSVPSRSLFLDLLKIREHISRCLGLNCTKSRRGRWDGSSFPPKVRNIFSCSVETSRVMWDAVSIWGLSHILNVEISDLYLTELLFWPYSISEKATTHGFFWAVERNGMKIETCLKFCAGITQHLLSRTSNWC